MLRRHLSLLSGVALAATIGLSGCGSDDQSADSLTKLTVAVSPGGATSTPTYLAVENGLFEERGLDVELTVLQDGTVAVPQVLNEETQFSMAGFGAAANATEQGLPVKLVGAANVIPSDPESVYHAIVVNTDAGIEDMADVRTWAASSTELDPSHAFTVDALGGDYESLDRRAVPYPAMGDAVSDGNADAALVNEPFLSDALENENVEVLTYVRGELTQPGSPGAVFIGSEEYIAENPEIAEAFMEAVQEAYTYAQDNLQEIAAFVPETGLDDQVPPVVALSEYQQGPLQPEMVDALLEVMRQYDAIAGDFTAEDMIYVP